MQINQEEADKLFRMKKVHIKELSLVFPEKGDKLEIELSSEDKKFNFQADINRKGIISEKLIYQNRSNKVFILRRLDFIGAPHRNPVGNIDDQSFSKYTDKDIPCPHLHFYIAGYKDKWALPLCEVTDFQYDEKSDAFEIMENFFLYCNIEKPDFKPLNIFNS